MQADFPRGSTAASDPFSETPYRALMRLGAGGMGEVFLIEHRRTGRKLVAKIVHPRLASDERLLDRVRVEAQALGRLHHPHIVSIVGFGTAADGRPFIVMEHLEGRTLRAELGERGRLPVIEALSYASQLLSALEAAHEIGVVHRDVKPDNLFICKGPHAEPWLKLLDFGVVRIMPDAPAEAPKPVQVPTEKGVIVGTPRYVSPEAVIGQETDPRSDLYAAGLVLYTMLAGRGPFDHIKDNETLLTAQATEDPEPPSRVAEAPVPPELDHLVLRALAKEPADRFQAAGEFREALDLVADALQKPQGWANTSAFDPASRWSPPARGLQAPPTQSGLFSTASKRLASLRERTPSSPSRRAMALVFVLAMLAAAGIAFLIFVIAGGPA